MKGHRVEILVDAGTGTVAESTLNCETWEWKDRQRAAGEEDW
jgi:hypothetical protein